VGGGQTWGQGHLLDPTCNTEHELNIAVARFAASRPQLSFGVIGEDSDFHRWQQQQV
jgi:hypothetical protein